MQELGSRGGNKAASEWAWISTSNSGAGNPFIIIMESVTKEVQIHCYVMQSFVLCVPQIKKCMIYINYQQSTVISNFCPKNYFPLNFTLYVCLKVFTANKTQELCQTFGFSESRS